MLLFLYIEMIFFGTMSYTFYQLILHLCSLCTKKPCFHYYTYDIFYVHSSLVCLLHNFYQNSIFFRETFAFSKMLLLFYFEEIQIWYLFWGNLDISQVFFSQIFLFSQDLFVFLMTAIIGQWCARTSTFNYHKTVITYASFSSNIETLTYHAPSSV